MNHIKIRGNNHYFDEINPDKKEAILLVHGHPFDHTMWRYQVNTLKYFRLILPDLKGYGKTDYKFDKIYIEEHALDLAFLLDDLKIHKVHLIGLSMGGQIIVEFARLFPHRVLSLVICDSNPSGETEVSYQNRMQLADKMLSIGMTEYAEQDIHKYLHSNTIDEKSDAYNHLYQMMINTKGEGAVASHRGRAERRDNFNYLKEIKVPTLVIVGDSDFFTAVNEMKEIASKIPNSKFAVVENAGHIPNMEQPEVFNKLLKDFYINIL
jgi:pimeloyl-ACP methyl ester carboxylesterase